MANRAKFRAQLGRREQRLNEPGSSKIVWNSVSHPGSSPEVCRTSTAHATGTVRRSSPSRHGQEPGDHRHPIRVENGVMAQSFVTKPLLLSGAEIVGDRAEERGSSRASAMRDCSPRVRISDRLSRSTNFEKPGSSVAPVALRFFAWSFQSPSSIVFVKERESATDRTTKIGVTLTPPIK
jgi:hypothetical protein